MTGIRREEDDMELTRQFARMLTGTNYDDISSDVIQAAKERLLDTIGAMLAGRAGWDYGEKLMRAAAFLGDGDRTPIGPGRSPCYPAARAAMLNASFAHAMELDDGHKFAGVHAGAVVIPTALEMGAVLGSDGREVLAAIVLGYEVVYRLAVAQSPDLIDRGFHPSAVCDTAGAAAVAGKLMGLDEEKMANALGLSGAFASGLMEATVSGRQSKCVMVGNAAFNGISCAYIAREGLEGPVTVFEGKTGLFRAMGKAKDPDEVTEGMGEPWWITETYNKFYPTCRHSQPAVEAALNMAEEYGIDYTRIERVEVGTHRVAYELTGLIHRPENPGEAKFSIAYGVALALIDRGVAVRHLKEAAFTNPEYLELADKVSVHIDEEVNARYPKRRGAKVTIVMEDGACYTMECYDLKGSPQNPSGLEELEKKFITNAAGLLREDAVKEVRERCADFEKEAELDSFLRLLNW